MRDVLTTSTSRWLRLGCLTLALGCGGDADNGKVTDEDPVEGDGDFDDGPQTGGDGDVAGGDGDGSGETPDPGEPGDPDAGTGQTGDGDGDGEPVNPGPSEAFLRGEAIAVEQECASCHQEDYAGLGFFPNLTPDATGLAKWSDAQITKAILEGVGSDGKKLCTGMPKFQLSEGEMADLIAFLRGLPAVKKDIKSVCPGHGK